MKRNCQNCNKEFTTYPNWIKRGGGKFCSWKCSGVSRSKKVNKVCLYCGNGFEIKLSTSIHNVSKYCSSKCGQLASRGIKRPSVSGDKSHTWKGGRTLIHKNCIDCEVTIYYRSDRCKSCSKIAELHPQWQGGLSRLPYPIIFNKRLKDRIRKRDYFVCQLCNITEEEHIIVFGKVLCVHHVDYNKDNCNDDNLLTLCHACNIRVNYNRSYWSENFTNLTKKEK